MLKGYVEEVTIGLKLALFGYPQSLSLSLGSPVSIIETNAVKLFCRQFWVILIAPFFWCF